MTISLLVVDLFQWTDFYVIETSVMKVLMNIETNSGNILMNHPLVSTKVKTHSDKNLSKKVLSWQQLE